MSSQQVRPFHGVIQQLPSCLIHGRIKIKLLVATAILGLIWTGFTLLVPTPPLNVIVISIDTLRPDRMGVYGHRPNGLSTTPFLDQLAEEGAVFNRAVSTSSWTLPAHHSLMSGAPNDLHGVIQDRVPPSGGLPMMAELLSDQGRVTGGFYSGPYLHPLFGLGRGFSVYESCMNYRTMYDVSAEEHRAMDRKTRRQLATANEFLSQRAVTSETVTEKGLRFVRENADEPFFLFLHYFDVHNDYMPPPPFDKLFGTSYDGWVDGKGVMSDPRFAPGIDQRDLDQLRAFYDGEIAWVDHNIRRLFDGIRKIDPTILENTLFVLVSDHGEQFLEHGKMGHRNNLSDVETRIPMIFWCPAAIGRPVKVDDLVTICDVLPTVADMAGFDPPSSVMGRSLLPLIGGVDQRAKPALLELTEFRRGETDRFWKHTSLIIGDLKLTSVEMRKWNQRRPLDFSGPLLDERIALYDLKNDPLEKDNLVPVREEAVERMLQARHDCRKNLVKKQELLLDGGETVPVEVPESLKEQLEQLGYGGS